MDELGLPSLEEEGTYCFLELIRLLCLNFSWEPNLLIFLILKSLSILLYGSRKWNTTVFKDLKMSIVENHDVSMGRLQHVTSEELSYHQGIIWQEDLIAFDKKCSMTGTESSPGTFRMPKESEEAFSTLGRPSVGNFGFKKKMDLCLMSWYGLALQRILKPASL